MIDSNPFINVSDCDDDIVIGDVNTYEYLREPLEDGMIIEDVYEGTYSENSLIRKQITFQGLPIADLNNFLTDPLSQSNLTSVISKMLKFTSAVSFTRANADHPAAAGFEIFKVSGFLQGDLLIILENNLNDPTENTLITLSKMPVLTLPSEVEDIANFKILPTPIEDSDTLRVSALMAELVILLHGDKELYRTYFGQCLAAYKLWSGE